MKLMPFRLLSILNILWIGNLILGANQAFAQVNPDYESIDSMITDYMAKNHTPGLALGIVKDTTLIWSKSYGKADVELDKPMSLDVIMNIGSISKTFTATAAMQLWEAGLLNLDTDINEYLDFSVRNPGYPEEPITLFQILTHTSSIQDGEAYNRSYSCDDPTISLYQWIRQNLVPGGKFYNDGDNYGNWSPGTKRSYSNIAFGLLGLVVERVARQPFNDYCRQRIFEPLGMNNTGWMLSEIDTANHASEYAFLSEKNREDYLSFKDLFPGEEAFAPGTLVKTCLYSFPNYPDGLVRTSVREISYYLAAIMNGGILNGQRILKASTVNNMLSLQMENDEHQGLCWYQSKVNQETALWGHNGGDPGVQTNLFFDSHKKIGFITFQNNIQGPAFNIIKALYKAGK